MNRKTHMPKASQNNLCIFVSIRGSNQTLFLQNKPNFQTAQNAVRRFILRTKDYGLRTAQPKNKPNSNPISWERGRLARNEKTQNEPNLHKIFIFRQSPQSTTPKP